MRYNMNDPMAGMNYIFGIKPENQPARNENSVAGAGILLVNPETKEMLLLFRNDFEEEDTWCIPGGGVDIGEEAYDAAIREVYEEALINSEKYQMKGREPIYSNKVSDDFTFHTFLAEVPENIEPQLNFEHSDWGWYTLDNLPQPMHPGVTKMFDEIDISFLR